VEAGNHANIYLYHSNVVQNRCPLPIQHQSIGDPPTDNIRPLKSSDRFLAPPVGRMWKALPFDKFTDHRPRDDPPGGIGVSGAVRGTTALGETTGLILVEGTELSTPTPRLKTSNISSSVS